ncbi:hypothetical protein DPEC_G00003080 [Dallia pectoralis]|uniref:Uncharacterized protein n=1 Tax=Dallia pectoralis TaxID=75939 RepID=A0ACC2HJ45_DALPE|nr:hypothetical protein DPEC_G00003080 [Dallia pectoralis]
MCIRLCPPPSQTPQTPPTSTPAQQRLTQDHIPACPRPSRGPTVLASPQSGQPPPSAPPQYQTGRNDCIIKCLLEGQVRSSSLIKSRGCVTPAPLNRATGRAYRETRHVFHIDLLSPGGVSPSPLLPSMPVFISLWLKVSWHPLPDSCLDRNGVTKPSGPLMEGLAVAIVAAAIVGGLAAAIVGVVAAAIVGVVAAAIVGVVAAAIVGVVAAAIVGDVAAAIVGVVAAAIVGVVAAAIVGLVAAAIVGLVAAAIVGLVAAAIVGLVAAAIVGDVAAAIVGDVAAAIVGVVAAAIVGVVAAAIVGLVAAAIVGLVAAAIVGLVAAAIVGLVAAAIVGLVAAAIVGLVAAAIVGLAGTSHSCVDCCRLGSAPARCRQGPAQNHQRWSVEAEAIPLLPALGCRKRGPVRATPAMPSTTF